MKQTVKDIESILKNIHNPQDPLIEKYRRDERASVRKLAERCLAGIEKKDRMRQMFEELKRFEYDARSKGFKSIAGIDEAGRGPLAGPVVAGAVILPEGFYLEGLNDSKKLSEKKRDLFFDVIQKEALAIGIGIVDAEEIDRINIYQASKKAMRLAIEDLELNPDYLLIDAMEVELNIPQEKIIKGDAKSISIAAGSVVAKVTRDRIMKDLAKTYPAYGFDQNMGYGTAIHLESLKVHGATPHHRKTFSPVKELL
ncbi:ribonuclease HII [Bacillus sp. FJAT-42376]|uniref:ribonuclease HII n=1 Tax=Bacillus sp. FJAT-42376 TaxID=2014076 RepID=UPI000F4EEF72|nr:ribonuclease HII [Bacillus sp. FJAT-42376]AZB42922.1 ribonuclease HII [Bacillus sp. FJAT-42376]